jgi:hypothetical protein
MTMTPVLMWLGQTALAMGVIGSSFPMWGSTTLSPDSIKRRFHWAGALTFVVSMFLSQLPDWRSATFGGGALLLGVLTSAVYWTNFAKIGGRIYAKSPNRRGPDRPPALSQEPRN